MQIGESAARIVAERTITLAGESVARPLSRTSSVKDWFGHPTVGPLLMQELTANLTDEQKEQAEDYAHMLRMVESMPMKQFLGFAGLGLSDGTVDRLIELSERTSSGATG